MFTGLLHPRVSRSKVGQGFGKEGAWISSLFSSCLILMKKSCPVALLTQGSMPCSHPQIPLVSLQLAAFQSQVTACDTLGNTRSCKALHFRYALPQWARNVAPGSLNLLRNTAVEDPEMGNVELKMYGMCRKPTCMSGRWCCSGLVEVRVFPGILWAPIPQRNASIPNQLLIGERPKDVTHTSHAADIINTYMPQWKTWGLFTFTRKCKVI